MLGRRAIFRRLMSSFRLTRPVQLAYLSSELPKLPDPLTSTGSPDSIVGDFLADPDSFLQDSSVSSSLVADPDAAVAALGFWSKLALFESAIVGLQGMSGLPYWMTIATFSIALRGMALPFQLTSMREEVKMRVYGPEVRRLNLLRKVATDPEQKKLAEKRLVSFSSHVGLRPSRRFFVLFPTAMFIPMFATLRLLCHTHAAELSTGGMFWFSNLAIPDPFFILPLINAGLLATNFFLAQRSSAKNVRLLESEMEELGHKVSLPPRDIPKLMKWALYGTFAVTGIITAKFSAGLFMFWIPTQLASIATTLVTRRWQRRWERDEMLKAVELDFVSPGVSQSETHSRIIRVDTADRATTKSSGETEEFVTAESSLDVDDLEEGFFEDLESQ